MSDRSVCPAAQDLLRLANGYVGGDEAEALRAHLKECDRCASLLRALKGDKTAVPARAPQAARPRDADDGTVKLPSGTHTPLPPAEDATVVSFPPGVKPPASASRGEEAADHTVNLPAEPSPDDTFLVTQSPGAPSGGTSARPPAARPDAGGPNVPRGPGTAWRPGTRAPQSGRVRRLWLVIVLVLLAAVAA